MNVEGFFVVTGASRGIGRAICQLLVKNRYLVIGLARDSNELQSLNEILKGFDNRCEVFACDFSDSDQVKQIGNELKNKFPKINGVIHNAGIIDPIASISNCSNDEWSDLIQVNLIAVQQLTRQIYPSMVNSQRCRVTTISSGAAVNSVESWSAYCTSKAGLEMWTKCLALEGEKDNISAISIAPGIVDTGMQDAIRSVSVEDFPMHPRFVDFKNSGQLKSPEFVAEKLIPLLTNHSMSSSGKRFDVREL